jgi:hypothetical protein
MSSRTEEQVAAYLASLSTLEPEPAQLAALSAAARARPTRRLRTVAAVALVILAGSSTLATATGLVSLPGRGPDPERPARVADAPLPAAVSDLLGVFATPALTGDAATSAHSLLTEALRAPYVVAPDSVRPVGDAAYIAYVKLDGAYRGFSEGVVVAFERSAEGPYPPADVRRGTAWGVRETGDGVRLVAILPDGVAGIRVTMDDGTRASAPVRGNVAFAPLGTEAGTSVDTIVWLDGAGDALRTLDF